MSITIDEMSAKLLTLEQLRLQLARSEPVKAIPFTIGDGIRFSAEPGYHHGMSARDADEPMPVYVDLGGGPLQLTRTALEEASAAVNLKKDYVRDCPAELVVPHLNYWFREGLFGKRKSRDFQFVVNDDGHAVTFTKRGLTPFSNMALLEQATAMIYKRFGRDTQILADYKLHHSLRSTTMRLVVPEASRALTGTGTDDDQWTIGLQLKNSLTGQSQTSFEGYLFRWVCTNGQIDTRAASGAYTRRKDATEAEVWEWARQSVDEALGGLEGALDVVHRLTQVIIEGSLADALRDVFEHYRISLVHRPKIIRYLEQYDGEITMYVVMNAITQVANDPTLEPSAVESLLRIGGDLPYTADQRCGACHRLMHQH